jgi:putative ABC transport system permease protein
VLSAFSQAWASWKTAPGIALLAVVAFALGIGSATAIFTVVSAVMLRPLPYPSGERFVGVYGASTTDPTTFYSLSIPDLQQYQEQATAFDVFGWFRTGRFNLTAPGEPQFIPGAAVTPSLARQLGPPALGQWFTDESGAVISTSLWQRLGGRRDIIGSAITMDDRRYTVTGVMPASFQMPIAGTAMTAGDTEVWIALDPKPSNPNPGSSAYFAYARRKPGVSLDQAMADAKRVAANIARADPARHPFFTARVTTLRQSTLSNLEATLLSLLAGAGLLLLIACANVATLLLARSVVRARETAIRVALGASRRQLAIRYFAEGAMVSVVGAAAGVGLSAIFVRQILAVASDFVPRAGDITIDWRVLGFSVALAIATGVLAGLAPLWQAVRTPPNAVLTEGVRASSSAPARRLSKAFVVAEIALAFTLLTSSVILVVHLRNLGHVSLGFDPDDLLTFEVTLPRRTAGGDARRAEQARLMEGLQQTPGVMSAAFVNSLPIGPGCFGTSINLDGEPPGTPVHRVCIVMATPDLLSTMRIPLRAGRVLTAADDDRKDVLPMMVNETAVREIWRGRSAVGARGRFSTANGNALEVVGVMGDVRNDGLNKSPQAEIYVSLNAIGSNTLTAIVRSNLPTDQLIAAVRRSLRQVNPTLAMNDFATMNAVVSSTLQLERLSSIVMTFFGLAALLMATLGIYGVMSYFVRQRTVEFGTRMALGAVNRDLVTLVLGGGLKLSLAGMAVGSIALGGSVWLLVKVLEVADIGWPPFVASTTVIGLVAAAAASVPAWRTTFLTPMAAIREQPPSAWRWARERMQRTTREIRQAVGGDTSHSDVSPADVLTAFVDAARSADSYTGALHAVLTGVCEGLRVDTAALLERRDGSRPLYQSIVAVGRLETDVPVVAADGFLITRLQHYPAPLPFAPNELATLADWAAEHRPDRLDEIRALANAGVRLAVPLRTRSEILGVLLLGAQPQRGSFSPHEKQVLHVAADQFALMIENARLTDRMVEQETLRRDIALASDVQRRLLPDAPPHPAHADFAAASVPARRVGGDYYDFVDLPDGGIGIALADVSGKGVAAALIMSVVQASLRIISSEGEVPLPRLVARMNRFVYRSTPGSKYATFFYAQLDEPCRRLRYVNAGHNPPFLLRAGLRSIADTASVEIEQLSVGGTVVGMFEEMDYEEATVELAPGDVLLVFTDGVPEAHNPDNEEFGEERLQDLLRQIAHLPIDGIGARISAEMRNWIGDAEQYDDLTFIVMKVR